ncbi:hypothetical protein KFK09_007980 [Dendrobium nobile]|uniref:Secreted protein n=1 Tax=Dendrobium nobile TaxID=94219 RepID=A0A8T3BYN8_DENNO|nr:hypothetical protein KFK09_007980 [Dendrobium nobile]
MTAGREMDLVFLAPGILLLLLPRNVGVRGIEAGDCYRCRKWTARDPFDRSWSAVANAERTRIQLSECLDEGEVEWSDRVNSYGRVGRKSVQGLDLEFV